MDEANMEADGGQQERQAKNEKLWKAYPPETYRNTIAELVHFSSKTVNSNAALAGVRLASDDALDAPYVSARTLMAWASWTHNHLQRLLWESGSGANGDPHAQRRR